MDYKEGQYYLYRGIKVRLVKIVGERGIIDLNGTEISVKLSDLSFIFPTAN